MAFVPDQPQPQGEWHNEIKLWHQGNWVLADCYVVNGKIQTVKPIRALTALEQRQGEAELVARQDPLRHVTAPNAITAKPRSSDANELLRRSREEPGFLMNDSERRIVARAVQRVQKWGRE